MNLSEWIAVVQTLVLAATGAVVVWYTYETYRIRKETSRQNSILAEQVRMLSLQMEKEAEERDSLLLPRFIAAGGMISGSNARLKFKNSGARIYDVEIIPQGDLKASRQRKGTISPEGQIELEVNWGDNPKPEMVEVLVVFTDEADRRRRLRITHEMGKGYAKQQLLDGEEDGTNGA